MERNSLLIEFRPSGASSLLWFWNSFYISHAFNLTALIIKCGSIEWKPWLKLISNKFGLWERRREEPADGNCFWSLESEWEELVKEGIVCDGESSSFRISFWSRISFHLWSSHRLTLDQRLARYNRFLNPKSSYERILMAPPCRLQRFMRETADQITKRFSFIRQRLHLWTGILLERRESVYPANKRLWFATTRSTFPLVLQITTKETLSLRTRHTLFLVWPFRMDSRD